MNGKISTKQFTVSIFTTLICGVIFIIVVPILALLVLDMFITFVALLDPLHQGRFVDQVWSAFIGIVITQIVFPILASVIVGVVISFLTKSVRSGWIYVLGMAVSLGIYSVFQFMAIGIVGVFASELVVISWGVTSFSIVGVFSVIIGLICVAVNRKISASNQLNS